MSPRTPFPTRAIVREGGRLPGGVGGWAMGVGGGAFMGSTDRTSAPDTSTRDDSIPSRRAEWEERPERTRLLYRSDEGRAIQQSRAVGAQHGEGLGDTMRPVRVEQRGRSGAVGEREVRPRGPSPVAEMPFEPRVGELQLLLGERDPFPPLHRIAAQRAGDRVLVSGTGPVMPDGSCPGSTAEQARRCWEIVVAALAEAGAAADDVVRTRTLLTPAADAEGAMAAHGEVFADVRPASTMVVVHALLDPRWTVEVEAEAQLDP